MAAPPPNVEVTSNSLPPSVPLPPTPMSAAAGGNTATGRARLASPPSFPLPPSVSSAYQPSSAALASGQQSNSPAPKPDVRMDGGGGGGGKPLDIKTELKQEPGMTSPLPPGSIKSASMTPSAARADVKVEIKKEDVQGDIRSLPSITAVQTPQTSGTATGHVMCQSVLSFWRSRRLHVYMCTCVYTCTVRCNAEEWWGGVEWGGD